VASLSWKEFENEARKIMSRYFGVRLIEKNPIGFPKKFDMVSIDESIIGDAKYLTLVRGEKFPPAKMMEITGHVWLLEKVNAKIRFLVFGNQKAVSELWLDKYGKYKQNVAFFFISKDGTLEKLE
jgi:hypothetical protein